MAPRNKSTRRFSSLGQIFFKVGLLYTSNRSLVSRECHSKAMTNAKTQGRKEDMLETLCSCILAALRL